LLLPQLQKIFINRRAGLLLLLLLLAACSEKSNKPPVVARVGDTEITIDEFKRNYEFGFANLKQGQNPKATYLTHMIDERLLTLEGYAQNLDQTKQVQTSRSSLMSELLIEALILQEVRSKIKIPETEIRREISEQAVSFKFRYYLAASAEEASAISARMKKDGFSSVDPTGSGGDFPGISKIFRSEYVNKQDVPEVVFAAIRDLPIGEISNPVELDGQFAIIQMLDIRRQALLEGDFKSRAASVEQQLFYKALDTGIAQYLDRLLTPKQIVTSGPVFGMLARAVLEWQEKVPQLSLPNAVQSATEQFPGLHNLAKNLDQPLTNWQGGQMTVAEFLPIFNPSYLKNEIRTRQDFLLAMNEAVQFSLRDYFLDQEARHQNLKLPQDLQDELEAWTDKWVYHRLRSQVLKTSKGNAESQNDEAMGQISATDSLSVSANKTGNLRIQAGQRIDSLLTKLHQKYKVHVFHQVLDTLQVDQSAKTRGITIQVFKSGSNRQAWPVTDPLLGVVDEPR